MPNQHPTKLWAGRRFGVEMEIRNARANNTNLNGDEVRAAMLDADLEYPVYGRGQHYASPAEVSGVQWEIKYDSTCGLEVVSPALKLNQDGESEELKTGCDALMALRPRVDRQCGLHVHVDVSDFSWKELQKLLALWARYEPFFYSMVPQSRRNNHYTVAVRGETWAEAHRNDVAEYYPALRALKATSNRAFESACFDLGKYRTLRMNMWAVKGRVEFRMHSGTVSYEKIKRWVQLVLSVVGRVKTSTTHGTTGRLASTVRPLARPSVFGPSYVLAAIGLGPHGQRDDDGAATTQAVYDDLMTWIPQRQTKFHGRAR